MQRVHFIAIGGSVMHNLAIALHKKGMIVTGSDDEIFEPSKSRLKKYGLLPEKEGWYAENISKNLNAVILGMHAKPDNPELIKAQELGIKIYSYPEYIYEQSKNKTRIVIGGSHGKTTITSMILHVLHHLKYNFDFLVGAKLDGFDTMVQITDAPYIIIEGDEYLASPIDSRPKFHVYKADIALITGIAWDHINVFPIYKDYVSQFAKFADQLPDNGVLVFCNEDKEVRYIVESSVSKCKKIPYDLPAYTVENNTTYLETENQKIALQIFGEHNLLNMNGARLVCNQIGVSDERFYEAISSFKGAARRLELVIKNNNMAVYKDFAHSPSKLKATTEAMKKQFPNRGLVACMELHTFSSLNKDFLKTYNGSMSSADEALVYFNPHTLEHKNLKPISAEQVKEAFGKVKVFTDSALLVEELRSRSWVNTNLLMMSSGNFDGVNIQSLAEELIDPLS